MTSLDVNAESQQIAFPIQSLYPELLSQIFIFCLPKSVVRLKESMRTTLTLCNVCSSWRVLATATPPLWTRFHLEVNWHSVRIFDIDSVVESIHTWLGRSGTHPLKIYFSCYQSNSESELVRACGAIAMYTSRWETIKICTNIPPHSWPNIGEAPRLHTLHVCVRLEGAPFTFAPRLTNLVISLSLGIDYPWPDVTNVPWHQLTNVVLHSKMADIKVLDIMRCCTRLESLRGRIVHRERDYLMNIPQIKHATLQVLDLASYDLCNEFLESLILPALSRLTWSTDGGWSYCPELVGLFDRSHCKLDHLAVGDCIFTSDEILKLLKLKSCWTLTSLVLTKCRDHWLPSLINDRVIRQMTFVDDGGGMEITPLCPNLAELTLHICITSPGMVGRMILSRCSKGRPLSVFNLTNQYDIAEEDIALLKLAEENGLRFEHNMKNSWESFSQYLTDDDDDI